MSVKEEEGRTVVEDVNGSSFEIIDVTFKRRKNFVVSIKRNECYAPQKLDISIDMKDLYTGKEYFSRVRWAMEMRMYKPSYEVRGWQRFLYPVSEFNSFKPPDFVPLTYPGDLRLSCYQSRSDKDLWIPVAQFSIVYKYPSVSFKTNVEMDLYLNQDFHSTRGPGFLNEWVRFRPYEAPISEKYASFMNNRWNRLWNYASRYFSDPRNDIVFPIIDADDREIIKVEDEDLHLWLINVFDKFPELGEIQGKTEAEKERLAKKFTLTEDNRELLSFKDKVDAGIFKPVNKDLYFQELEKDEKDRDYNLIESFLNQTDFFKATFNINESTENVIKMSDDRISLFANRNFRYFKDHTDLFTYDRMPASYLEQYVFPEIYNYDVLTGGESEAIDATEDGVYVEKIGRLGSFEDAVVYHKIFQPLITDPMTIDVNEMQEKGLETVRVDPSLWIIGLRDSLPGERFQWMIGDKYAPEDAFYHDGALNMSRFIKKDEASDRIRGFDREGRAILERYSIWSVQYPSEETPMRTLHKGRFSPIIWYQLLRYVNVVDEQTLIPEIDLTNNDSLPIDMRQGLKTILPSWAKLDYYKWRMPDGSKQAWNPQVPNLVSSGFYTLTAYGKTNDVKIEDAQVNEYLNNILEKTPGQSTLPLKEQIENNRILNRVEKLKTSFIKNGIEPKLLDTTNPNQSSYFTRAYIWKSFIETVKSRLEARKDEVSLVEKEYANTMALQMSRRVLLDAQSNSDIVPYFVEEEFKALIISKMPYHSAYLESVGPSLFLGEEENASVISALFIQAFGDQLIYGDSTMKQDQPEPVPETPPPQDQPEPETPPDQPEPAPQPETPPDQPETVSGTQPDQPEPVPQIPPPPPPLITPVKKEKQTTTTTTPVKKEGVRKGPETLVSVLPVDPSSIEKVKKTFLRRSQEELERDKIRLTYLQREKEHLVEKEELTEEQKHLLQMVETDIKKKIKQIKELEKDIDDLQKPIQQIVSFIGPKAPDIIIGKRTTLNPLILNNMAGWFKFMSDEAIRELFQREKKQEIYEKTWHVNLKCIDVNTGEYFDPEREGTAWGEVMWLAKEDRLYRRGAAKYADSDMVLKAINDRRKRYPFEPIYRNLMKTRELFLERGYRGAELLDSLINVMEHTIVNIYRNNPQARMDYDKKELQSFYSYYENPFDVLKYKLLFIPTSPNVYKEVELYRVIEILQNLKDSYPFDERSLSQSVAIKKVVREFQASNLTKQQITSIQFGQVPKKNDEIPLLDGTTMIVKDVLENLKKTSYSSEEYQFYLESLNTVLPNVAPPIPIYRKMMMMLSWDTINARSLFKHDNDTSLNLFAGLYKGASHGLRLSDRVQALGTDYVSNSGATVRRKYWVGNHMCRLHGLMPFDFLRASPSLTRLLQRGEYDVEELIQAWEGLDLNKGLGTLPLYIDIIQ